MTWLRLHRRIVKSNVAQSDELLGLFVRLLAEVNFRAMWFRGVEIQPGQMAFAWRLLPKRLYPNSFPPSINTIKARLKQLEELGAVRIEPHSSLRFSVLTIAKWHEYQRRTVSATVSKSDTVPDTVPDTERRRDKKVKKEKNYSFDCSELFNEWYSIYPRKVAPDKAKVAYAKALLKISKTEGVDNSRAASLLIEWTKQRLPELLEAEVRYRPYPASWLNAGQYRNGMVSTDTSAQTIARVLPETKVGNYEQKPKHRRAPA
ncbi:MAG: hypothetical protein U0930_03485 [Pirellulales bacterium]